MPEQIRLKVGGETPQQIAVYEEFARNIPGFLPLSEPALPPGVAKPMAVSLQVYDFIVKAHKVPGKNESEYVVYF